MALKLCEDYSEPAQRLVLGDEELGSMLPAPERAVVARSLRRGTVEESTRDA